MRKLLLLATCVILSMNLSAKNEKTKKADEGFVFTTIKANPITSVKNQNRSGTCWCFSTLGFLESELLKAGKGEYDLSEMFVVHKTMEDRAKNYVRYHGDNSFAAGGSFYDVMYCMNNYGLVPQEVMPGIMYGDTLPNHGELDAVAEAYTKAIAKSNFKKLTPVWEKGLCSIYDTYLGKCPTKFTYKDVEYTPQSFAQSLGLNPDDYVSLTSYTHHPFYTKFSIEVQDNWRNAESYNLPLDELMKVMDYAVNNGYTFAWGSDVSEDGFTRDGIAVMPEEKDGAEITGTDMAKWTKMTKKDKDKELTSRPLPEIKVTQEMRQKAFDDWETTDDHGMQIFGIAKDQKGKPYFMVKNSWGTSSKYKGIWYASNAFVAYKTMNILINKNAIPNDIRQKLGIN
ncbi:MAG: aminopeptidase [Bacteroidaceae bacterium]|nr:aminopeptidase [Bacteroidaceae bacterium]